MSRHVTPGSGQPHAAHSFRPFAHTTSPLINLKGHLEVLRVLVAKGANLNARDLSDWTPLQNAVGGKHVDAVQFLIAKGADVNLLDNDGVSALDTATRFGPTGVIEMLKNAGAKCGTNHSYSRNCKEAESQN